MDFHTRVGVFVGNYFAVVNSFGMEDDDDQRFLRDDTVYHHLDNVIVGRNAILAFYNALPPHTVRYNNIIHLKAGLPENMGSINAVGVYIIDLPQGPVVTEFAQIFLMMYDPVSTYFQMLASRFQTFEMERQRETLNALAEARDALAVARAALVATQNALTAGQNTLAGWRPWQTKRPRWLIKGEDEQ